MTVQGPVKKQQPDGMSHRGKRGSSANTRKHSSAGGQCAIWRMHEDQHRLLGTVRHSDNVHALLIAELFIATAGEVVPCFMCLRQSQSL